MRESVFVVGLFAAGLVTGYLAGTQRDGRVVAAVPSNYDPPRAACADALKSQTDATDRCWKQVVQLLRDRR